MNGRTNQIKSEKHTSNKMVCEKLHQPEQLARTLDSYEGNLADEIANAEIQPVQIAELPSVAAEDFESLFSWFIS
jgi:hypothetical protein